MLTLAGALNKSKSAACGQEDGGRRVLIRRSLALSRLGKNLVARLSCIKPSITCYGHVWRRNGLRTLTERVGSVHCVGFSRLARSYPGFGYMGWGGAFQSVYDRLSDLNEAVVVTRVRLSV